MAEVFLGSLMCVPYNFAPKGFAFCLGQLLPISQNTALFSLLGTTYGGDGRSTFALPDLQGRVSVSSGQAPGLSIYDLGSLGGTSSVSLQTSEMPGHNHSIVGTTALPNQSHALGAVPARKNLYGNSVQGITQLAPNALGVVGGSQSHENLMPTITLNWIIALTGIFPSRP